MYGERVIGDRGMSVNIVFKESRTRQVAARALPRVQVSALALPVREQGSRTPLFG